MPRVVVQRRHTAWDVLLGFLLVVVGIFILGHVLLATAVSVLLLGWLALISGAVALLAALLRIGKGGFWSSALSGGLLLVLGLMILRNSTAAALTLTLVAGALFFAGGITRIFVALQNDAYRWLLLLSGAASLVLGLFVLFNLFETTFTLLGILLGAQTLIDGFTQMFAGRVRVTEVPSREDHPVGALGRRR